MPSFITKACTPKRLYMMEIMEGTNNNLGQIHLYNSQGAVALRETYYAVVCSPVGGMGNCYY